jgi:putative transcriptional regulator
MRDRLKTEEGEMMIVYDKLFSLLTLRGHNKHWLRCNGISPSVLDKLGKGGGLDYRSINKLCRLLACQPGDLMEYIPDANEPEKGSE